MPAIWTPPITWQVDQLVTNDDLNEQVRDNLEYLLSPSHLRILRDNSGTYNITSVTTFQDIDAANLSITLETHGGPTLVHFQGSARSSGTSNPCFVDLAVNGVRMGAAHTFGLLSLASDGAAWVPLTLALLITGLPPGVHTFRPQWRTASAATFTLRANSSDNPVVFEVIEL